MTTLQALIFDVDGTLADTERDGHRVAFNQAFQSFNLDWHWSVDLYRDLTEIGGGKERIHHYITQYHPNFVPDQPLDLWIPRLHQAKTQYYQALLSQGSIPLRPGVKRLILAAKEAGIRLAIATTSAYPNALALLEQHLDPTWFELIAAGDMVPHKKPAPDIYQYVLEKMHLDPPSVLVVVDSQPGLVAATSAGLTTLITINPYTQHQNFAAAQLVVNHLGEPDAPCQVLQGKDLLLPYVTLSDLSALIQEF